MCIQNAPDASSRRRGEEVRQMFRVKHLTKHSVSRAEKLKFLLCVGVCLCLFACVCVSFVRVSSVSVCVSVCVCIQCVRVCVCVSSVRVCV